MNTRNKPSLTLLIFMLMILAVPASALSFQTSFGGQIKIFCSSTDFKNSSLQSEFKNTWFDTGINLRIKSTSFFKENISFNYHYLVSSSLGDSTKASSFFKEKYPGTIISQVFEKNFEDDNTALFDLSSRITQGRDYFLFHRLDRLNLTLDENFGRITLGRQAVTWGNGIVFNPMDVFNPFSPYDTLQDYKKGEDMAYFETFFETGGDLQFLYVPRRDADNGNIKFSKSSIAAKYHLFVNDLELDMLAAKHYQDILAGIGIVGNAGNAVWRSDLIYAFAGGDMENDFLSFIMNIDYSWVWFEKNFYGFIEYYYSSLGTSGDYSEAFTDHDLSTRINRQEIYGFGQHYLSSGLAIELNPLLNLDLTIITNLADPSCFMQPKITWNAMQNLEITVGSNIAAGGKNDEYGQIQIPSSLKTMDYGSSCFLWITRFF